MRLPTLALAALAPLAMALAGPPPAWTVDKAHSRLGFTATVGGQAVPGEFKRWDAQIAFDPANLPASKVSVTIDPASALTGDKTRDEALPTPDWFGVKAFPRAVFTTRSIAAAGPGRYVASGDLTIRNVTGRVSLPFTLAIAGKSAKMAGTLTIDRGAFSLGQGQFKDTGLVAGAVKVQVVVEAVRAR